jgi:glycosyltransferase involved in cell wall biosynthesis
LIRRIDQGNPVVSQSTHRIGFVSTRFAGTDGVSLETFKWAHILAEMGHECFYFAGECDQPEDHSMVVPEAHFSHPTIYEVHRQLFDRDHRTTDTARAIQEMRATLRRGLDEFVARFQLDMLIVENALSIPMNIPLGLALTEQIAETGITTIAHHHDFAWERQRFARHMVADYLAAAFPPPMESIHHVTINSYAARQLAQRTGMRSTIVPNVMDFDSPAPEPDGYADDLRRSLGIEPGEHLLLQPTRVVPRKRIELAIILAHWLERPCKIVIPHSSGDEGDDYRSFIARLADTLDVRVLFAEKWFAPERRSSEEGEKVYGLADAYQQADLVTYPSATEGFGNAFLEAIYYKKPLVMCSYEIFKTDIEPKGFHVVAFEEGFITNLTVERVRTVLQDRPLVELMTQQNYDLGRRYFSYTTLRRLLDVLIGRSAEGLF